MTFEIICVENLKRKPEVKNLPDVGVTWLMFKFLWGPLYLYESTCCLAVRLFTHHKIWREIFHLMTITNINVEWYQEGKWANSSCIEKGEREDFWNNVTSLNWYIHVRRTELYNRQNKDCQKKIQYFYYNDWRRLKSKNWKYQAWMKESII